MSLVSERILFILRTFSLALRERFRFWRLIFSIWLSLAVSRSAARDSILSASTLLARNLLRG